MATIEKHQNKSGITYRITVSCGCDSSGKRIRRRTTFRPPPGMTPKQAEKAAQRAAADFERSIGLGYSLDNSQSFAEYADYALAIKSVAASRFAPWSVTRSLWHASTRPSVISN